MAEFDWCIYRYFHIESGISYVGLTDNIVRRKTQHLGNLRRGQHHSVKLQQAYNQYGKEAFAWEIVEQGLSKENAVDAERRWIDHYDSQINGFNMKRGGQSTPYGGWNNKSCEWEGVTYESRTLLAREVSVLLGVTVGTVLRWLAKGYSGFADVQLSLNRAKNNRKQSIRSPKGYRPKQSIFNGKTYKSQTLAAEDLDVSQTTISRWQAAGHTCDDDVVNANKGKRGAYRKVVYGGDTFDTLKAAADANGISPKAMAYRLSCGYSSDEDMRRKRS